MLQSRITTVWGAEKKKQQRDCGRGIGGTFNPRFRRCGYLVELAKSQQECTE